MLQIHHPTELLKLADKLGHCWVNCTRSGFSDFPLDTEECFCIVSFCHRADPHTTPGDCKIFQLFCNSGWVFGQRLSGRQTSGGLDFSHFFTFSVLDSIPSPVRETAPGSYGVVVVVALGEIAARPACLDGHRVRAVHGVHVSLIGLVVLVGDPLARRP